VAPPVARPKHLWECAALAWTLLRSAFLPIDWNNLPEFVRRFHEHIARLKKKGDPLQVAAFLARLGLRGHAAGTG